ncbi:endo-1,4-beta-xylanase [Thermophagus xiamenensis]|nr:endo-1,4-beta-xylanase [Thermophagus xiamenensis]
MKDSFSGKIYFKTALNACQIIGYDSAAIEVVKKHFNTVVEENCMKS